MVRAIRIGRVICLVLAALIILSACSFPRLIPCEGIWMSEDGEICINLESSNASYCTINGRRIRCAAGNDKGSTIIMLMSCEAVEEYYLGEPVFSGKSITFDAQQWKIRNETDQQTIVFRRIG